MGRGEFSAAPCREAGRITGFGGGRLGARLTLIAAVPLLLLVLLASAAPAAATRSEQREGTPNRPSAGSSTCAGIRGNGQNLFAH